MSRKIFPGLGDDNNNNPGPSSSRAGFSGKPEWTSTSSTSRYPSSRVVKDRVPVMDRKRYLHHSDISATTTDGHQSWMMSLRGIKRKNQTEFKCEAGAKLSRMVDVEMDSSALAPSIPTVDDYIDDINPSTSNQIDIESLEPEIKEPVSFILSAYGRNRASLSSIDPPGSRALLPWGAGARQAFLTSILMNLSSSENHEANRSNFWCHREGNEDLGMDLD